MKKLVMVLILILSTTKTFALSGHLEKIVEPPTDSKNWAVQNPQIYVMLGPIGPDLAQHYTNVSKDIEPKLQQTHPEAKVTVVPNATSAQIIYALQDPNTVGLVIISHAFKSLDGLTGSLIDSKYLAIPNEILSAATPSLRFFAFFGCYGPEALKSYQVDYEMPRIPGHQEVFYTSDESLATSDSGFDDGVANVLNDLEKEIEGYNFKLGDAPEYVPAGVLRLTVKDVVADLEPRFVLVNGTIVGVLGDITRSNTNTNYADLDFAVPTWALANRRCGGDKSRVVVRPAELTPGYPADDYILSDVTLKIGSSPLRDSKFTQPLHLGDDSAPMTVAPKDPGPIPPALAEYYKNLPPDVVREAEMKRLGEYLLLKMKYDEWIDRDPSHWSKPDARFFSGCI